MSGKRFSFKIFLICLLVISFLFLSLIFFFRKEWLEPLFDFLGVSISQENGLENEVDLYLSFLDEQPGESLIYLKTDEEVVITGVELNFEKDLDLEIVGFICEVPFECINSMWSDDEFYVAAVTPLGSDVEFEEDIVLGRVFYEGTGSLYVTDENSFVTTSDDLSISLAEGEYVLSF